MRLRLALALVFTLFLPSACDPNAALREQAAVEHLRRAENRVRTAANAEKGRFLQDMAAAPCPVAEACRMREACVGGYTLHVDGLKLTEMAKLRMSGGQDAEAARLLGSAEAKLKEAGPAIARCTDLSAELARSYHVNR